MARNKQIHVKVDERELKEITRLARRFEKTVSEFLRELALAARRCRRCKGSGLEPKGGR